MSQPEIVMLVPNLPPAINGIGDYALNLAQQLYHDRGWQTRFILGDPTGCTTNNPDFAQASTVAERSPQSLAALLPSSDATLLLHYAGHGYARRGCPVWLVQALTQWCRAGGRLITMFHELYATKPLLSSATVTRHFQKRLTTQLIQLSDRTFTNRQRYAEQIRALSQHKQTGVITFPVFSNVGEVRCPQPLQERSRELVVFGSSRALLYQRSRPLLETICEALQIQTILDVGAALEIQLDPVGEVPIRALGVQSAEQISQILGQAIAGVISYPTAYLAKSGIFAAYCSHGILPIVVSSALQEEDKLKVNQHYWLANGSNCLNLEQGQAIATAAHNWYQQHSLKAQAQCFSRALQNIQPFLLVP